MKFQSVVFLMVSLFCFFSCEKELSVENGDTPTGGVGSSGGTARYSFDGGTGGCAGANLNGLFIAGKSTTTANSVVLAVTVDSVGTYTLSTGTINGISFAGSGTFTSTGVQEIILNASGTPSTEGVFNFVPGTTGCTFSVAVQAAPVIVTGNFTAKIDGTQWVADRIAQGARMNGIINISGLGLDKKFVTMTLQDSGVHQYTLAWDGSAGNGGAFMDSTLTDVTAFVSNDGSSPDDAGGTVNITSIDETNKTMSGTFSFKARRSTDNTSRTISEGVFTNIPYITTLPPGNATDTFNVKIDGVAFTPSVVSGINNSMLSSIIVQGTDATGVKGVAVYFPPTITPGIYTIGSLTDPYFGQYNSSMTNFLASNSGTLEILFHDPATKRIRGKFNFAAEELTGTLTAQISEGYFAVTYQ